MPATRMRSWRRPNNTAEEGDKYRLVSRFHDGVLRAASDRLRRTRMAEDEGGVTVLPAPLGGGTSRAPMSYRLACPFILGAFPFGSLQPERDRQALHAT